MTVSVAATSFLGKPLEYARNLIASSSTWQTLCDVETIAAAKPFIDYGEYSDPETFPHCLVSIDSVSLRGPGTRPKEGEGAVRAIFYLAVPSGITTYSDMYMTHMNSVGAIIADLQSLVLTNGNLAAHSFSMDSHGLLETDSENGDLIYVSEWLMRHPTL